jgi:hypothetical protein
MGSSLLPNILLVISRHYTMIKFYNISNSVVGMQSDNSIMSDSKVHIALFKVHIGLLRNNAVCNQMYIQLSEMNILFSLPSITPAKCYILCRQVCILFSLRNILSRQSYTLSFPEYITCWRRSIRFSQMNIHFSLMNTLCSRMSIITSVDSIQQLITKTYTINRL